MPFVNDTDGPKALLCPEFLALSLAGLGQWKGIPGGGRSWLKNKEPVWHVARTRLKHNGKKQIHLQCCCLPFLYPASVP